MTNAERLVKLLSPQQDGLAPTEANLLHESQGVVARESKTLFDDDLVYTELDDDPDYGHQMCEALDYLDSLIKIGTLKPNDPKEVADILTSLQSNTDPAPKDLTNIVDDAYNIIQNAFPQCNSTLEHSPMDHRANGEPVLRAGRNVATGRRPYGIGRCRAV